MTRPRSDGRIEPDAVQPVAEGVGDAERLLGLVLERVDEDDPGHLGVEVAVEREGGLDGVAEDQDERVGHRPRRGEACEPGAGRGGGPDAAADDRGVVEDVGDVRVDVASAERDDGGGRGDVDALAGRGGPAGRLGEHPEDRGLVQAETPIPGVDPEDDLLRRDPVAVVERLDPRLRRVAFGEDVADQVLRLVDPAEDRILAGEDLHRHDGVHAFPGEDRFGAGEVDVGRVAGQDLARRPRADEAHQRSRVTMRLPCRWALRPGRSAARRGRPSSRRSPDGRRV